MLTARQIIEARLGRDLGPLATMPRDTRQAIYLLALQLVGQRTGHKRKIGRRAFHWTPHVEGRACTH